MTDSNPNPILPAHIEDTVQAIARLQAKHNREATPLQRFIENLTARAGRSGAVGWLTGLVSVWIGVNVVVLASGHRPWDPPPFNWLQGFVGLAALYMTMLILATQRREDLLASHREQLTLELAILSEQKAAKIIELLEELRRDDPTIRNRVDREAAEMSMPSDPQAVLEALIETHQELRTATPDLPEVSAQNTGASESA